MNKQEFIDIVKPYTMTTEIRISSLYDSLEEIRYKKLDGDFVECGVWKAGNILGIINYLDYHKMYYNVWLYDTFDGMINPGNWDFDLNNQSGRDWVGECYADLEFVKNVLSTSEYPKNLINIVKGDVCRTLLDDLNQPESISLLRLDTDWYESTKIELEVLYPKILKNGILIIDDYGHWKGCKKAVDEYFKDSILIEEVDYTCVKIKK